MTTWEHKMQDVDSPGWHLASPSPDSLRARVEELRDEMRAKGLHYFADRLDPILSATDEDTGTE